MNTLKAWWDEHRPVIIFIIILVCVAIGGWGYEIRVASLSTIVSSTNEHLYTVDRKASTAAVKANKLASNQVYGKDQVLKNCLAQTTYFKVTSDTDHVISVNTGIVAGLIADETTVKNSALIVSTLRQNALLIQKQADVALLLSHNTCSFRFTPVK